MKKAIFSLLLVIPLVTVMPAPAVAHLCCCAAIPPRVPPNPTPPCNPVQQPWADALCTPSSVNNPCSTKTMNEPQTIFHYIQAVDPKSGALLPLCTPDVTVIGQNLTAFKTLGGMQPVEECTAGSPICAFGECPPR
jgi:hypothetical protein